MDSCRRKDDVGATLVVAPLPDATKRMGRPQRSPLQHQIGWSGRLRAFPGGTERL